MEWRQEPEPTPYNERRRYEPGEQAPDSYPVIGAHPPVEHPTQTEAQGRKEDDEREGALERHAPLEKDIRQRSRESKSGEGSNKQTAESPLGTSGAGKRENRSQYQEDRDLNLKPIVSLSKTRVGQTIGGNASGD